MTTDTSLVIEPAEMRYLVETLGAIGEQPGGGIIRHVYDAAWVDARRQLADWMRDADLAVREDAVGNLFGRFEGDSPRTILTGSHVDTVRLGGRYDGALGVLSALAAVRLLAARLGKPKRSLEMVALCEEEDSRFHCNFWGTRGILGLIAAGEIETLRDENGISIGQAMADVGLAPERFRDAIRHDLGAVPLPSDGRGSHRPRWHHAHGPAARRPSGRRAHRPRNDAQRRAGWPPGGDHQWLVGRS